jgi:hypothetical protein
LLGQAALLLFGGGKKFLQNVLVQAKINLMKIGKLVSKVIRVGLLVAVIATSPHAEKQSGGPVTAISPVAVVETIGHDDEGKIMSDVPKFPELSADVSGVGMLPDELEAGLADGVPAVNPSGIVTVVRSVVDLLAVAEDLINTKQLPDGFVSLLS